MKTLTTYIVESLTEYYHFTNIGNLVNIADTDTFELSETDTTRLMKSYKYYMSLTRSSYGGTGYVTGLIDKSSIVRVVLDGKLLNSKYKIASTDYYTGAKKQALRTSYDDDEEYLSQLKYIKKQTFVEAEDRVFSNSPQIKNFHKYIKELDIYLTTDFDTDIVDEWASKFNIKINYYTNKKSFDLRTQSK